MIIKRRCDIPMARKKGLLPCAKRCKTCVACICMDEAGNEFHTRDFKGAGDPALAIRNQMVRSYYGDYD